MSSSLVSVPEKLPDIEAQSQDVSDAYKAPSERKLLSPPSFNDPSHSPRTSADASTIESLEREKEATQETSAAPSISLEQQYLVGWDSPDDPENPQNWSRSSRWYYTALGGLLVFNATFASSSPSGIVEKVMADMGFGTEVATLMISLFIGGYCVGPLLWGPLSETYGRKPIFVDSFIAYTAFQIGCAVAPNTGALLAFRFLGGCFAASPLANAGSLMGDIWDQRSRGKAIAIFTLAPFAGPALGPIIGGAIGVSDVSWRWLFWVLAIFAGLCLGLIVFTLPETYAPIILKRKAELRRKETGDDRHYAPLEVVNVAFGERARNIVEKPVKILFQEPMLMAVTIYMSFCYGCLYLLFEAYPIVFVEGHGFNSLENGLTFLPLFVGGVLGCIFVIVIYNPRYTALVDRLAPTPPAPEERLPMAIVGAVLFALSFFWFGWTSYNRISYWAPMMSGLIFGLSLMFLFLALFNYIIDVYLRESASALSATTIVRSIFGATFPLFASQMYDALNPRWASTLLGLVATIMIPIPLLFIRYGPALRARSKFAPVRKE